MKFYLGTHEPSWLSRTSIPLFLSYNRLIRYKTLPRAKGHWALDSGAFTQLACRGRWTISAAHYANVVQDIAARVGKMQWASIQDWICSPHVLASTGLTLRAHQKNTIQSLVDLRKLAPSINWIPVLQGWDVSSYLEHLAAYRAGGFDLDTEPIVGVGSLANRKDSPEVYEILREIQQAGVRTHAFGLSGIALKNVHHLVESADSLTWSYIARRRQLKHPRCRAAHVVCNNCFSYATAWRKQLINGFRST